ncbi:MAG: radical SAM protein [Candidatus Thorarchaeota archaeon]
MRYECVKAKSLLSKTLTADSWFHVNRTLNAYRGCEHGCVYCDGMSEHYHVDNFMTHIRIKENAPEILNRELKKDGYTPQSELETETLWSFLDKEDAIRIAQKVPRRKVIGVCGGVSDGYQPAETEHAITRSVLETLVDFGMPAFVLTKSDLVLRDLDVLQEIHKRAFANVMFTITLHDEETQKVFEPRASTTSDRFSALKEVRKKGLFGGVMATPLIPGIGDSVENIRGLSKEAKEAGAEFIQFGGMTLKPGRQKDYFLNVVKRRFPENLELIRSVYSDDHPYGQPNFKRLPVSVMTLGYAISKEVGISDRSVRHKVPHEYDANNLVLSVLLDIAFRRANNLGLSWSGTKPYSELAARLERGVDDLTIVREQGELSEYLQITPEMAETVEEILDRGTCQVLEEIEGRLDDFAEKTLESYL